MMGGTAFVKSEVDKGSLFGFNVRLATTEATAVDSSPEDVKSGEFTPKRILLAEDGHINQRVAIGLLTKRGHHVEAVENGKSALEALEKSDFDVVLMDVQMPVMDGLTAVRHIRHREQDGDHRQYVVAMTAHAMTGDRERFISAGMDTYLMKPFRADELFAAVERTTANTLFNSYNHRLDREDNLDMLPVLNEELALELASDDRELMLDVRQACMTEVEQTIDLAREAASKGEVESAKKFGHTMKSSLAAIGATAASDKARRLEQSTSDTSEEVLDLVDELHGAFKELENHLAQGQ